MRVEIVDESLHSELSATHLDLRNIASWTTILMDPLNKPKSIIENKKCVYVLKLT
jgi:hypothetical protein